MVSSCMQSCTISVPASLSNLGSALDVLGLAVELHNHFHFHVAETFQVAGQPAAPHTHLAFATALDLARHTGTTLPPLAITQQDDVPRARGLGSSATARIAGLLAWRHFTGWEGPLTDVLPLIVAAEGHPDNVVPALFGGLCLCAWDGATLHHVRLDPPPWAVALCVPAVAVPTPAARAVLPTHVPRADAVFNLSRGIFLLQGLLSGDPALVAFGVQDRLHQPYRAHLIGPLDAAIQAARAPAFLSGSGSTVAALVRDGDPHAVAEAMAAPFRAAGIACQTRVVMPCATGARVSPITP